MAQACRLLAQKVALSLARLDRARVRVEVGELSCSEHLPLRAE